MHSPGLFSPMVTRKSSVPLFKSNSPATMGSMISFPEKVGPAVFDDSWTRSKLLIAQAQV